jgi:lipopolysaccharide/colanic/teichoic acid biosynthesis glycosyltransferase
MIKRIFDVVVAAVGLIVLAPVFLLIAVLVKVCSPGPVFFKGERIGQYGTRLRIIKFRSMVPDASRKGGAITSAGDPRVTKVGRFLRRTKLDELPSLINVLKGEMSLVGPRPEAPVWVERYTAEQRTVLTVKPGITGLSQIKYRSEEQMLSSDELEEAYSRIMSDKLDIDLDYVGNQSFTLDLRILMRTGLALLRMG